MDPRGAQPVCRPHAREAPCQTWPERIRPRNGWKQHACGWALQINADGKFTDYWALADDQDAVNAFCRSGAAPCGMDVDK
jgi:hypothetical protein